MREKTRQGPARLAVASSSTTTPTAYYHYTFLSSSPLRSSLFPPSSLPLLSQNTAGTTPIMPSILGKRTRTSDSGTLSLPFPPRKRFLLIYRDQLRNPFHASNVTLEEKYSTTKTRTHLSLRLHAMKSKIMGQWTWTSCPKQSRPDQHPPSAESLGNEFHCCLRRSRAQPI